jgi:hypothetical protein
MGNFFSNMGNNIMASFPRKEIHASNCECPCHMPPFLSRNSNCMCYIRNCARLETDEDYYAHRTPQEALGICNTQQSNPTIAQSIAQWTKLEEHIHAEKLLQMDKSSTEEISYTEEVQVAGVCKHCARKCPRLEVPFEGQDWTSVPCHLVDGEVSPCDFPEKENYDACPEHECTPTCTHMKSIILTS